MPSPPRPAAARDLEARLSRIEAALASNPELAEREAREILAGAPDHPMALLFQAIARRRMGDPAAAVAVLESLCRNEPNAPLPHLQLGLALRETGDDGTALTAMQRAVAVKPDFSDAWLALADLRTALGDRTGAEAAFMHYLRYSSRDPLFLQAASLIRENRAGEAEKLLREQLGHQPRDLRALFMLAELANGHSRFEDAEKLLTACLELAPGYAAARHNLAVTLMRQNKLPEALRQADRVVADDPEAADALNLRAAVLLRMLEYDDAIDVYRQILRRDPQHVTVWSNLGHTLRTVGRLDESILAYRRCIALDPSRGEAWWNLANLKTVALSDSDLDSMRAQAERSDVGQTDRVHLHFAIGKALEDRQAFAESFAQYAEGNRLRREMLRYDPDELAGHVARCKQLFTREFFAARAGWGASAAAPVFVIGLPRTGSTLVEQILASHSDVEGTMELTQIADIARSLAARGAAGQVRYPEVLASLTQDEARTLGERYLERTRVQRKRGARHFIDKMPNNFAHIALIRLILPNAIVIDVRRHPLACGLSLFKHLFAHGQHFSYSLEDIGRYYRDYVELMRHFDAVLPGYVHRVTYESLVEDTDAEVRRLLEYCGLPFEGSCLRFFDNRRAVNTASSEQVRTPIFHNALDHWRHYEPWLDPLREQVAPSLSSDPE